MAQAQDALGALGIYSSEVRILHESSIWILEDAGEAAQAPDENRGRRIKYLVPNDEDPLIANGTQTASRAATNSCGNRRLPCPAWVASWIRQLPARTGHRISSHVPYSFRISYHNSTNPFL